MIAVKAKFDGKNVILPQGFQPPAGGDVIVVFEDHQEADQEERSLWMRASEEAFRTVWHNPQDDIYDEL